MSRRSAPYVWVTWLAPLLAGDKHCWWAAWFRAHFQDYEKRPDPRAGRLAQWKGEHAAMVRDVVEETRADGWEITVEEQNKLHVRGRSATVGACPDIVASHDHGRFVIECKTGQRRDSDWWQVAIYLVLMELPGGRFDGRRLTGIVRYRDGGEASVASPTKETAAAIFTAIGRVAAEVAPARVPSAGECGRCEIACCPDRATEASEPVDTEAF